jgi:hypothetical protein
MKMTMQLFCRLHGIPQPVAEHRFHASRRWRFDYAWPDNGCKVALEIEGGAWTGGRHFRGKGALADMEKYNEAAIAGWIVIRRTPSDATNAECADLIKRAIASRLDR